MTRVETPWSRGRFDGSRKGSELLFGRMFEDAAIEREVFRPGSRVFAIGSAGCTAFALAEAGHRVCAVDVNESQVAYVRARANGADARLGKADRLMARGRNLIWPQARLAEFMELASVEEQVAFWNRHLNTRRFRWSLRVLLTRALLRLAYSDQMIRAIPPRLDLELRRRLECCWARFPNNCNPCARALFLSEYQDVPRFDHELLEVHHAEAASFLEQCEPARFDAFTLSNILDATPAAFRARLFSAVKKAAAPGAIAVLRSFRCLGMPGVNRARDDRSILWGTVQVMPVEQL